jgi:Domain of unknown function (DUF4166)/Saccharopine dehydrogenase NADP binding domain
MTRDLRVLIIGGYGTFGGRIVQLLENEPRLTLIVAGRSLPRADAFRATRTHASARLVTAAFDRDGDLRAQLASQRPDIVVDASGPFQAYGDARYRVIEACIAEAIGYLDLADGSDFVAGVRAFDDAARTAGIFVLSGVSSFPVLTAAVVRRLTSGVTRVDSIQGGIAPSPFAGVGGNVIRAIASYAGQRVVVRRKGKSTAGYPLTEHMRFTIAPPGRLPLRNTLFSLVDVPDLRALAELWPEAASIWMGAGPVPEILHRALTALAWAVRLRLLPTLAPIAPLMRFAMNHLRWGEHRGGMFVEIEGLGASGSVIRRSWHLLAEGEDGPLIPSMAVEALVRKALRGQIPIAGARAAMSDLELEDYEELFRDRTIYAGIRDDASTAAMSLYPRILGAAWNTLPQEIRAIHTAVRADGRAGVERGQGLLSRWAAFLTGFPKPATDIRVTIQFDVAAGVETWTRTFGDQRFSSRQFAGTGRSANLLCERFGPLTFSMALVVENERLSLVLRRWRVFGIPLPMWLSPRSIAYETVENGRFHFHVEIGHPLTGLIVRYHGWLVPGLSRGPGV